MKKETEKIVELVLETEGKKEHYVLCFDPKIGSTTYDRFALAADPQKHLPEIRAVLAMKGQNCIVPKAQWEKTQKDRSMGIYPWIKGKEAQS